MSAVFFEWQQYEQMVMDQFGLSLPDDVELVSDQFNLEHALGHEQISIFVDSKISQQDLEQLVEAGCKQILIRAAGFDMLDINAAKQLGIEVCRVASYSPESIAEYVFALLLTVVRKLNVERRLHEQKQNVREVSSMGTTLAGKTLGLYGIGKIGAVVAQIAQGFGMQVQFFDKFVDSFDQAQKVTSLAELFGVSDVVSIHVPLTDETKYSVSAEILTGAKPGLVLINTSRGDIVDSNAVIAALDAGKLSGMGVDVWDSGQQDDLFDERLLRDNVIQTHHIAFFTAEAVMSILKQTIDSLAGNPAEANVL